MKPLAILFCICLVDVMGFGIIIPLLPYIGTRLGATPALITPIMASYSFCQFVAAPIWGRLSDRYGRRPILMSALAGLAASYVLLAYADSLLLLLAARLFGGLMAGNLSAAMAYASDVTQPENRARGLGLIGAAIGIGFAIGPAVGGVLAGADAATANFSRPAFVSAGMSLLALAGVVFALPESHRPGARVEPSRSRAGLLVQKPILRILVVAVLLMMFANGILESIAVIWSRDAFGFGPRQAGLLSLAVAIFSIVMQGGLVGRLVGRFGERQLAAAGVCVFGVGLGVVALPGASSIPVAVFGLALCGIGSGAFNPSAASLASRQAGEHERGAVLGTYQSAASLARILGPLVSGPVYEHFGRAAPFGIGIVALVPAAFLIGTLRREAPQGAPG